MRKKDKDLNLFPIVISVKETKKLKRMEHLLNKSAQEVIDLALEDYFRERVKENPRLEEIYEFFKRQ